MSEIKNEIKQNVDGSFTITDAHSTADIIRWLLMQDSKETILYLLNEETPQRTWVDLNTNQILDIYQEVLKEWRGGHQVNGQIAFAKAIQDKFKEVNT